MPTLFDKVLLISVSSITIPVLVLIFAWLYLRNPVFAKDVQTRMRGARAYVILGVYLGVLSLVLAIAYLAQAGDVFGGGRTVSPGAGAEIGRTFYWALLSTQGAIIILFTPAFTAGAITLEREQQTFDMLLITRLRPEEIVWGRLWSAAFFPFLLLLTSAPLVSVTFLLGGVSPGEMVYAFLSQALCALVIGSLGILSSVLTEKTALSTITAFGFMIGYVVITTVGAAATSPATGIASTDSPFAGLNPFFAIGYASEKAGFFTMRVPAWLTSAVIAILLTLAVGAVAVQRLSQHYQRRKTLAPWILLTAIVFVICFLIMGWLSAENPLGAAPGASPSKVGQALRVPLLGFFCAVLGAAIVLAPGLCSSDGLCISCPVSGRQIARLLHPRTWLTGERVNALPYFIVWIVLAGLLGLLGLTLAGGSVVLGRWQNILAMFATFALAVLCYCTLSMALSGLLRRRWAAAAIAYALIVVVLILPLISAAASYTPYYRRGPSRIDYHWTINSLYLNPFAAMAEAASPGEVEREFRGSLAFGGSAPFYVVHIIAMAALTALFALVALVTTRRRWEYGHAPSRQAHPQPPPYAAAPGAQAANPAPQPAATNPGAAVPDPPP